MSGPKHLRGARKWLGQGFAPQVYRPWISLCLPISLQQIPSRVLILKKQGRIRPFLRQGLAWFDSKSAYDNGRICAGTPGALKEPANQGRLSCASK